MTVDVGGTYTPSSRRQCELENLVTDEAWLRWAGNGRQRGSAIANGNLQGYCRLGRVAVRCGSLRQRTAWLSLPKFQQVPSPPRWSAARGPAEVPQPMIPPFLAPSDDQQPTHQQSTLFPGRGRAARARRGAAARGAPRGGGDGTAARGRPR